MWVLRVFEFVCEYIYICNMYIYYRGKVSTRSRLFFFSSPLDYPLCGPLFFFCSRFVSWPRVPSCSWKERSLLFFLTTHPPALPGLSLSPSASCLFCLRFALGGVTKQKKKMKKKKHTQKYENAQTYLAPEKSAFKNHRPAARTTRAWECKLYL
jgi:hypothetical protein